MYPHQQINTTIPLNSVAQDPIETNWRRAVRYNIKNNRTEGENSLLTNRVVVVTPYESHVAG